MSEVNISLWFFTPGVLGFSLLLLSMIPQIPNHITTMLAFGGTLMIILGIGCIAFGVKSTSDPMG